MLQENQKVEVPVCGRCKKAITDICYVEAHASMILQQRFDHVPQIFYNKESADNYSQRIPMHSVCWIDTLRDHGVKLHDMAEVFKKQAEERKKKTKEKKK